MTEDPEEILHSSNIVMIDPLDCGSTIGYSVRQEYHFSGEVHISDCNRKIVWYFNNKPSAVVKIDKAIKMLTEFKKEFVKYQKQYNKEHPKKETSET